MNSSESKVRSKLVLTKNLNLTRRQLIDHLLDEMNEKGDKETMQYLIDRQDAVEKLKTLCPKRK